MCSLFHFSDWTRGNHHARCSTPFHQELVAEFDFHRQRRNSEGGLSGGHDQHFLAEAVWPIVERWGVAAVGLNPWYWGLAFSAGVPRRAFWGGMGALPSGTAWPHGMASGFVRRVVQGAPACLEREMCAGRTASAFPAEAVWTMHQQGALALGLWG